MRTSLDAFAQGDQENSAFACGMGIEKPNHVVVVEGEPSGAEALSIGGKVELAADNSGLELHSTISTIAEAAR